MLTSWACSHATGRLTVPGSCGPHFPNTGWVTSRTWNQICPSSFVLDLPLQPMAWALLPLGSSIHQCGACKLGLSHPAASWISETSPRGDTVEVECGVWVGHGNVFPHWAHCTAPMCAQSLHQQHDSQEEAEARCPSSPKHHSSSSLPGWVLPVDLPHLKSFAQGPHPPDSPL